MSSPQPANILVVARAWLEAVTPAEVAAGDALPDAEATTPAGVTAMANLRSHGFVRISPGGGAPSVENPMRHPVVTAECFVAPDEGSSLIRSNRALRLAEWIKTASDDPSWMGRRFDLAALGFGSYSPVRVHTVVALSEPRLVLSDRANYARSDLDLIFHWNGVP